MINELTGRRSRPAGTVAASSLEHRKALLSTHYSNVLNASPPSCSLLPIPDLAPAKPGTFNTAPFSHEEVHNALANLRADVAPGVDGISPRVLKIPELTPTLTDLLNNHCCLGEDALATAPPEWRTSMIVSIPKKGRSSSLDNQRGIAIGCAPAKLLSSEHVAAKPSSPGTERTTSQPAKWFSPRKIHD